MNKKFTNRLAKETSPYLLQHAHNPVDWFPWGEEAFEKAKTENKPVLVSIGYSTCHWCHVMERESFEDERIAAFMNEHYVNIKVDREERPDVDQIYMEAIQVITGAGGWPLNCFLTPDAKPFYGGTYFPPHQAHNRPSWYTVLSNLSNAFNNKREVIEEQAEKLLGIVAGSGDNFVQEVEDDTIQPFNESFIQDVYYNLRERFDNLEGGFGGAPKFPNTMGLRFLLNYYHFTGNKEALGHLELSLDKMILGGIYDQLGGGFSRYTVDREWMIPHFEKMLYDNALLIGLLADVYKVLPKPLYKTTIIETLEFVKREMSNPNGGFYSAYDADSEGVEGKFYVWDKKEIQLLLGEEAELFCLYYGVTDNGNWESVNILWRATELDKFASLHNKNTNVLQKQFANNKKVLFTERSKRVSPGLDDKILLNWNALMSTAFAKAGSALQNNSYCDIAKDSLAFILLKFQSENYPALKHTFKEGKSKYDAFLDDYAFLIEALLNVHTVTFDPDYVIKARELTEFVLDKFFDKKNKLFYFTSSAQDDLIVRKKDLYDGAIPSGNSVMVENLMKLGALLEHLPYEQLAHQMLLQMQEAVKKYASSFSKWAECMMYSVYTWKEIAVIGPDYKKLAAEVQHLFIPNKVMMAAPDEVKTFPLLRDRSAEGETLIYLCENKACKMPVYSVEELLLQLKDQLN